jgi:hypothetical protein
MIHRLYNVRIIIILVVKMTLSSRVHTTETSGFFLPGSQTTLLQPGMTCQTASLNSYMNRGRRLRLLHKSKCVLSFKGLDVFPFDSNNEFSHTEHRSVSG